MSRSFTIACCVLCGLLFVEWSLRVGVVCVVCDACCMRCVVSFELITCVMCLLIVFCVSLVGRALMLFQVYGLFLL